MSPAELRRLNIEHLERVLRAATEPDERQRIERLIVDERDKPDSAYPAATPRPGRAPGDDARG
jgi:hypothetical protein